jgi:hypothetical protein
MEHRGAEAGNGRPAGQGKEMGARGKEQIKSMIFKVK